MGLPYQRHQRLNEQQQKRKQISSSGFDFNLLQKPFWIWDKKEHLTLGKESDGHCYWNHIVGLPQKNKKEYPLFDYEKLLYNSLLSTIGSFKDKHLWVKKSTGLGVTEFMLRIMAWLCTKEDSGSNGACQMCIVTGPNIDIAIKLIRRLKNIFERKLGLTFTDKETILQLHKDFQGSVL
jgi:late competence protein required for DNA uptake (superfamily II DNA/RNA helicase)